MSKVVILLLFSSIFSANIFAGKEKVQFSTSEQDANIYVDGKLMGKGSLEILINN